MIVIMARLLREPQNYTDEKLLKIHRVNTKVVSTRRTMRDRIQLRIPAKKLSEFCQRKGYGTYETTYPSYKPSWLRMDDEEILLAYNAEMQGIANYYLNVAPTELWSPCKPPKVRLPRHQASAKAWRSSAL